MLEMPGGEGTLMHMLWDCPRIQEFWVGISAQIERIQRHKIPFSPSLFVLGDPSLLRDLSPSDAEWIQTVLRLGRKLIMCEWKASEAPSVNSWFSQLGHLAALEKLTFRLMNKVDLYMLKWNNWETHIKGSDRGSTQLSCPQSYCVPL